MPLEDNPVGQRRPISIPEVHPTDPRFHKVVESQIALVTKVNSMDVDLCSLGQATMLGFARLEEKLDRFTRHASTVPPSRNPDDSAHHLALSIGEQAAVKVQQIIDDPSSELTSEVVKQMVTSEVTAALAVKIERARVEKLEADAAQIADDAIEKKKQREEIAKEKRELWRLIVSGVVVGVLVAIAGGFFVYAQGRLTGHGEGFAERSATPTPVITIPIPVPIPVLSPR